MRSKLTLASTSPRRREILIALGLRFDVLAPKTEEIGSAEGHARGLTPEGLALENALSKALGARSSNSSETGADPVRNLFLGVDTIVVKDGIVLSKPGDIVEARQMLGRLQGARHEVLSALCLASNHGPVVTKTCTTAVYFAPVSEDEIDWYLASGEFSDKAGGYGIQGLASLFIPRIEGCYFNVVGLPVRTLYEALSEMDVPIAELSAGLGGAGR